MTDLEQLNAVSVVLVVSDISDDVHLLGTSEGIKYLQENPSIGAKLYAQTFGGKLLLLQHLPTLCSCLLMTIQARR